MISAIEVLLFIYLRWLSFIYHTTAEVYGLYERHSHCERVRDPSTLPIADQSYHFHFR